MSTNNETTQEIKQQDTQQIKEQANEQFNEQVREKKVQNPQSLVHLVIYDPTTENKFSIKSIPFKQLSFRHPLVKKSGAIFADLEYAKQFYNFVVTNAKEQTKQKMDNLTQQFKQNGILK